jgi:hypothetical protein
MSEVKNPHTGSTLDSFLEEDMELLEKGKCVRCGAKTSGGKGGRCAACLAKLAANKKKPGHWQRAQTKADDALRRQKGKNGTASKKSSGLGSRESIVKQTQSAEKKTGQKLSPDRKNNGKGYAASNTRMVPEKLNRGRHHVDPKKLRAWKKRLKKSEVEIEDFYTLMKAKATECSDTALLELLKNLSPEGLQQYIELFDQDEELEKSAAKKLEPETPETPSIHNEIGKVHTVEIHPDMDHLYRAKGLITENNRPHLHVGDYKKAGFPSDIVKKLPRDAHGKVTPEMIDKHIEGLPKHKVNVKIMPYTRGSQQHRPGDQYVASVQMHPESELKMHPDHKKLWNNISYNQHSFEGIDPKNQIGWSRIDAHSKPNHWHIDEIQSDLQNKDKIDRKSTSYRNLDRDADDARAMDYVNWVGTSNGNINDSKREEVLNHPAFKNLKDINDEIDNHYKTNEFDYDGQIKLIEKLHSEAEKHGIIKPLDHYKKQVQDKYKEEDRLKGYGGDLLNHISHGHEDPQHMIHSAINALGRKQGIKSMSMDTPYDQARQSELNLGDHRRSNEDAERRHRENWEDEHAHGYREQAHNTLWNSNKKSMLEDHSQDPEFASALKKVGGLENLNDLAYKMVMAGHHNMDDALHDDLQNDKELGDVHETIASLSGPEKSAINNYLIEHKERADDMAGDKMADHYPGYDGDDDDGNEANGDENFQRQLNEWTEHVDSHEPYRKLDSIKNMSNDPNFHTAADKMDRGHLEDVLRPLIGNSAIYDNWSSDDSLETIGARLEPEERKELKDKVDSLTAKEKEAVSEWLQGESNKWNEEDKRKQEALKDKKLSEIVPVHQLHTYKKRPSRLGMKTLPKKDILGEHPNDKAEKVQYMNLHKKLQFILEQLKKHRK